jgi:hypothetical protein
MANRVFSLRASEEQISAWKTAAARRGWPPSLWIRQSLDEAVALERAVEAEAIEPAPVGDLVKFKPDPRRR